MEGLKNQPKNLVQGIFMRQISTKILREGSESNPLLEKGKTKVRSNDWYGQSNFSETESEFQQ